jgi:hypothetical protein
MRWQMFKSCWLSRKLDAAGDFDEDRARAVDHDVGDIVARQQRLERTVAEHVVADVVEQFLLLGNRHHDVFDRDDLVDDVANFLARGFAVELGELRQIDRLDQRAEDRRLDLIVGVGTPRLHRRGCRRRSCGGKRWRRHCRGTVARNRSAGSWFRRSGGLRGPWFGI